jgi:hypothetical protein
LKEELKEERRIGRDFVKMLSFVDDFSPPFSPK